MTAVSVEMETTWNPVVLMASLRGRGHRSLAITQNSIVSSAAAQDSIGLGLPDPGLGDFPVDEELGEIGIP